MKAKQILFNSYKAKDCCDFVDMACTIEDILCNCKIHNITIFDNVSVYNRVRSLSKLYLSNNKFRKEDDITYAKKTCSYFTNIIYYLENLGK